MSCLSDFKRQYKALADTTLHLMKKVPDGKEDWTPSSGEFMTMGQLLFHLGDTQKFLSMIINGTMRELDKNFAEYMGHHPSATKEQAIAHFAEEHEISMALLDKMTEDEFHNKLHYFWTVADEPMPFISYNIIQHNASHKYQLFMYLKLLGLPGMDSLALDGEDSMTMEEIFQVYGAMHKAYDEAHKT
jgi:uncharacterized damage-inducible protein DinB